MLCLVFPVGFDGFYGDEPVNTDGWNHGQGVDSHLPDANNDAWLHTSSAAVDVGDGPGLSNEELEGTVDATGNSLYWFWDSTWAETRS